MSDYDNPYTPEHPIEDDRMFKDRDDVVVDIVNILGRPPGRKSSCAVVGGPGMGRTSILKCIQRKLLQDIQNQQSHSSLCLVPAYIKIKSPKSDEINPLRFILSQIIEDIKKDIMETMAKYFDLRFFWPVRSRLNRNTNSVNPLEDIYEFAEDLWSIVRAIESGNNKIKGDVKLAILIDDLHIIRDNRDLYISIGNTLINLLDSENEKQSIKSYTSFVLACMDLPMLDYTVPLFNVIEPFYIKVFQKESVVKLITEPLRDFFSTYLLDNVIEEIYRWIGGYPKLVHLFMYHLCDKYQNRFHEIDIDCIRRNIHFIIDSSRYIAELIERFLYFDESTKIVFELLIKIREPLDNISINNKINIRPYKIDNILSILEYFGIITEIEKKYGIIREDQSEDKYNEYIEMTYKQYRWTGEVFKCWFIAIDVISGRDGNVMTLGLKNALLQEFSEQQSQRQLDKKKFHQYLIDSFNKSELRSICFDLGIDYDSLDGQNKSDKARELILYVQRRDRTDELIACCTGLRPHLDWQSIYPISLLEQIVGSQPSATDDSSIPDLPVNVEETKPVHPGADVQVSSRRTAAITREQFSELHAQLDAHPEATLKEHAELWNTTHGTRVSWQIIGRIIRRHGWTRQKATRRHRKGYAPEEMRNPSIGEEDRPPK